MLFAFFDIKGMVYTLIALRSATINPNYTMVILGRFMKNLQKKRPEMMEGDWCIYWDNALVQTAKLQILRRLFPFQESQGRALWPPPVPEEPQDRLRRCHQGYQQAGVRSCFQVVVQAL
jgi:hypothetical protein